MFPKKTPLELERLRIENYPGRFHHEQVGENRREGWGRLHL